MSISQPQSHSQSPETLTSTVDNVELSHMDTGAFGFTEESALTGKTRKNSSAS